MKTLQQFISESEQLLMEARLDVLKEKYRKAVAARLIQGGVEPRNTDAVYDQVFRHIEIGDPTPNKIFVDWLIRQYLKNMRFFEDLATIREDLVTYMRVKQRMPADQRDINRFKTYHEFRVAIEPFEATQSAREIKQGEAEMLKKQIRVVVDSPVGRVLIPTTQDAAVYLGRGTKWCTAASEGHNYFNHYTKDGPLYVFMPSDGEKFQLHFHSAQFMDARDYQINLESWLKKYSALFAQFAHVVKMSEWDVKTLIEMSREVIPYIKSQLTSGIIGSLLEKNLIWIRILEGYGIKLPESMIQQAINERNGQSIATMIRSPDVKFWIPRLNWEKIKEAFKHDNSVIWRLREAGKVIPDAIVRSIVSFDDIKKNLEMWSNDDKNKNLKSFEPALTKEMLRTLGAKNKAFIDAFVDAGVHIPQDVIPDIKKEVTEAIKNFKLSLVPITSTQTERVFHTEDKRMMDFVFTDGVFYLRLPEREYTANGLITFLHLKNLDRFAGAGATENLRQAVVKEVNRIVYPMRNKKVMIFVSIDSDVTYVMKATGYRLNNFPVLSKIIGTAYHLVNEACSGKKAFDMGFRPQDISNLIGQIVKQMTL